MIKTEHFEQIVVTQIEDLRGWLLQHHTQTESVWLVTYKKHIPSKYIDRWDVLDELICFGWIDGIRRKLDADRTMQLISPRRVQHWAQSYKERAKRLIANKRMHEAGLKSIEASKSNGLWNFMDDVDQLIIPDDLSTALKEKPSAELFFNSINKSSKRFVLRWLKLSKTTSTRERRIKKIVDYALKGEKIPGS